MGLFRIVREAAGGHGCQRELGDGEKVFGCRRQDCADCVTQEYIVKMKKIFVVNKSELIHWSEDPSQVIDEIVRTVNEVAEYHNTNGNTGHYVSNTPIHRIRHGKFPK